MSTVSPAALPDPPAGRPLRLARSSDELLARYAARGSDRAFAALYERYYQPLYGYCRSILRNDADAQDALQSTFTGALSALRRDGRNAPLRPWLYRIAHNESISLLRRRGRDIQYDAVPEPMATGSSAEEEAAGRARWRRLVDDLAALPERQRGALLLRELAGLSHEDIAVALGFSVGAAKQAIFEARQGLAELEEGREMNCDEVRQRVSEGDRRVLRGRRVKAHLRECAGCEAFALAIPARRSELRAFAPVLPATAAASVLSGVLRAASPHGGASAAAGSAATAGAFGKVAGMAVAWKAVAGVAIIATTAAGVTGLTHVLHQSHPAVPVAPQARPHVAKAAGAQPASTHSAAARAAAGPASHLKSHRAAAAGSAHHATPGAGGTGAGSASARHGGAGTGRHSASASVSHGQSALHSGPAAGSSRHVYRSLRTRTHRMAVRRHSPKPAMSGTAGSLPTASAGVPLHATSGASGAASTATSIAPKSVSGATGH